MLKNKKVIIVLGMIVLFIASFVIYDYVAKANELKRTNEHLTTIEEKVQDLFASKAKDNITNDINESILLDIQRLIDDLDESNFTEEHKDRLIAIKENFEQAQLMFEFTEKVNSIFDQDGLVKEDADVEQLIDAIKKASINSDVFKEKQLDQLKDAKQQLDLIHEGKNLVNSLFNKNDNVLDDITRADLAKAEKAVEAIKHQEIVDNLEKRLATADEELSNREHAEQQRKKIEQAQQSVEPNTPSEQKEQEENHNVPEPDPVMEEINELEMRLHELELEQYKIELELDKYPTHTDEYRSLLEQNIDILTEMELIMIKITELANS